MESRCDAVAELPIVMELDREPDHSSQVVQFCFGNEFRRSFCHPKLNLLYALMNLGGHLNLLCALRSVICH